MKRLTFDTETTGKWNFKAPYDDPSQPNLVQLGAQLHDEAGVKRAELSILVEPEPGWVYDPGAVAVHQIAEATAMSCGVTLPNACYLFHDLVTAADTLVAHNIDFDLRVVRRAFMIAAAPQVDWDSKFLQCTMRTSTNIVQARYPSGRAGNKWPSLSECIRFFYDEDLDGAHDALVDVKACVRIHDKLTERGCWK